MCAVELGRGARILGVHVSLLVPSALTHDRIECGIGLSLSGIDKPATPPTAPCPSSPRALRYDCMLYSIFLAVYGGTLGCRQIVRMCVVALRREARTITLHPPHSAPSLLYLTLLCHAITARCPPYVHPPSVISALTDSILDLDRLFDIDEQAMPPTHRATCHRDAPPALRLHVVQQVYRGLQRRRGRYT